MRPWPLAALGGLGILGGLAIAWWMPNGPLLAWWLTWALFVGSWIAFTARAHGLRSRLKWLLAFHTVLIVCGLLTTHIAARRLTSATHLRFEGVHFERVDSILIGSGQPGTDVRLPTLVPGQTPWHLAVTADTTGWTFTPRAAVEQVRVEPVLASERDVLGTARRLPLRLVRRSRDYAVVNGTILHEPGDVVVVRDHRGREVDRLELVEENGEVTVVRRDDGRYALAPGNPDLASRYARMLRTGTALSSLGGDRDEGAPWDRFVRVQRLPAGHTVNGYASGWSHWLSTTRVGRWMGLEPPLLLSASAPFTIEGGRGRESPSVSLADSVRVEVRHAGALWRFDLVERRREPTAELGLAVRFVQNPRPLDSPLPGGGSCEAGVACGLLSLRTLPSPVAHISLAGAGFDPERFGLLARLDEVETGVEVMLPTGITLIPRSTVEDREMRAIPVTRLEERGGAAADGQGPRRWVLLSASGNYADSVATLGFIALGIALLTVWVWMAVTSGSTETPTWAPGVERYVALGVNAVLTLLLVRLIVGARVTFFEPFEARGLDTAIGMWVAASLVTVGLTRWSAWAPRFLRVGREISVDAPGWIGRVGRAFLGELPLWGLVKHAAILALATAALIHSGSRGPVLYGVFCGVAVLFTWFAIAWTEAFSNPLFHAFDADGPFEVVEHDAGREAAAGRIGRVVPDWPLFLLPVLWALAVLSPVIGAVAALGAGAFVVARARRNPAAWPDRNARLLAGGYLGSTLVLGLLRSLSENGALAAFVLVVLVALVGIRSGRALAAGLGRGTIGRASVAVYLALPLILLIPLGAADMGLLLVMIIPVGAASILAVGLRRLGIGWSLGVSVAALAVVSLLFGKVLRPDMTVLRSPDPAERAERFDDMQGVLGMDPPIVGPALERAASRAVAALDREAAEELLLSARPGRARDLLIPAIEQAWGGRAYAAAGWMGVGLGAAPIGRGVAESVSYAENSYAVYILHEHGVLGGMALLAAYLAFLIAVGFLICSTPRRSDSRKASEALFLVAALVITIPAAYVALSNLSVVPITGQNMPFLGLNAWSDVALCAGVLGILITGALRLSTMGTPGPRVGEGVSTPETPGQAVARWRGDWRDLVTDKGLSLALLGLSAVALLGAGWATVRTGHSGADATDLEYHHIKNEVRALMENRGPEGIASARRAEFGWGEVRLSVDTLAVTGDSLLFPSLAEGGFLRDQIQVFNDFAVRRAVLDRVDGSGAGLAVALTPGDTPSLFRLTRTDSAFNRLSRGLNEYALLARSPFSEQAWRSVRTEDWRMGPAAMGLRGELALGAPEDAERGAPRAGRGECLVSPRGEARRLLYCTSAAGAAVGAAFDLGIDLRDGSSVRSGVEVDLSRREAAWFNGVETETPAGAGAGDLVYTASTGPLSFSDVQDGILASRQWINGRSSYAVSQPGTLGFFGRAGRAASPGSGPLTLAFDAAFSTALQDAVDAFAARNGGYLEKAAVVVADARTGEVRAIVEAGQDGGGPLVSFEPVLVGSMVKPILAAAILSQEPQLADLEVDWAGPVVSAVSGVPVGAPFANALNGCGPRIDLEAYLRCSVNQYAVELLIRSVQRGAGRSDVAPDGVVPNAYLEGSPLASGLFQLFGDRTLDVVRRPVATGRTDEYWRVHPGVGPGGAAGPADSLQDRTLYPWTSRPWFIDADEPGTPASALARFAIGGWENRWTLLGLAEAYARIATGREVKLSFLPRPVGVGAFPEMVPEATQALRRVRGGLRGVGETGTASGLSRELERVGGENPLVLLAKTGTLNEVTARAQDDDVYVKTLALALGRPASEDRRSALRCGLVAVTYFEFRQDWRRATGAPGGATLPDLHRDFAADELAPLLREGWERMGWCRGDEARLEGMGIREPRGDCARDQRPEAPAVSRNSSLARRSS